MKNFIVVLCKGNRMIEILKQERTIEKARWFIEDNYVEFQKDICQYSRYRTDEFIIILKPL